MSVGYPPGLFDLITVRDLDRINQARTGCAHLVLGSHGPLVQRLPATAVA